MHEESKSLGDKFYLYEEFFLRMPKMGLVDSQTTAEKLCRDFESLCIRFGKRELLTALCIRLDTRVAIACVS